MVFDVLTQWKFDSMDSMTLVNSEAWRSVFRRYMVPLKKGGGEYVLPVSALESVYGAAAVDALSRSAYVQGYNPVSKNYEGVECTRSFDAVLAIVGYMKDLHDWGIHLQMDLDMRERIIKAVKAIPLSDVLWLAEDGLTISESDLEGCFCGDWVAIDKCLSVIMSVGADI